jgi:hypothetical protein
LNLSDEIDDANGNVHSIEWKWATLAFLVEE